MTTWTVSRIGEIHAAFHYGNGALTPCEDQSDPAAYSPVAQTTFALWSALQAFPQAALMVLRSSGGVSVASRKGGMIIEAGPKLNIGLLRAGTKHLDPVPLTVAAAQLHREDRFRHTFWSVMARLHGAALPRALSFDLAGATGIAVVRAGTVHFSGDFHSPADFIGELRAACEIAEDVKFTLIDVNIPEDAATYPLSDLIAQIATNAETNRFKFDASGWPVCVPDTHDLPTVQALAAATPLFLARAQDVTNATLSLLSDNNSPILTASITENNETTFTMA